MSPSESDVTDKERDLIENVAKKIAESDTEFFAVFLLETFKPIAWISGELGHFFLAPFLPLMDDKGYDFIDTFEQRKNIDRLLKRVKQLVKEKEKTKKTEKPAPSPFERLKSRLFPS
jgi:hypothetical protein